MVLCGGLDLKLKCKRPSKVFIVLCLFFIGYLSLCMVQGLRYDREFFNCRDMSYEVAGFFRLVGIGSDVVYVRNVELGEAHCFVCVGKWLPFESTCLCPLLPLFTHRGWEVYNVVSV